MAYSFLGIKKLHDTGQLIASYRHNFREYNVENASRDKQFLNQELVGRGDMTYLELFNERMNNLKELTGKQPLRKNGVMAFEIVCSITHPEKDFNIDLDAWKKDCVDFVKEKFNKNPELYGENVISAVYHGDEASPHIHMLVLPVGSNGKFAACQFYNGKFELADIRQQYAQKMYENYGLDKGQEHSITKHQDIKNFYDEMNQHLDISDVPKMTPDKDIDEYNRELTDCFEKIKAGDFRQIKERDYKIQRLESRLANTERNLQKEREGYRKDNERAEYVLKQMVKKIGSEKKLFEEVEFMTKLKLYLEVSKDPEVKAQYCELKDSVNEFCEKYLNRNLYVLDFNMERSDREKELEVDKSIEEELITQFVY